MTGGRSFDEILSTGDQRDEGASDAEPALDLTQALAELARIDLRTHDLAQVLQRIAELAEKSLPGAEEVSVSLIDGGDPFTPASTGPMALSADEAQYAEGSGPCLEAASSGKPVLVQDMTVDQRWPGYVPQGRAAGVGSSMSVPLPVQAPVLGALNIYAGRAHAFDEDSMGAAQAFAGYAAVAVANAQLYETTAALARQLEEAMASRAEIEQAKGLIMGQRGCTAEEAFQFLVSASSRSNRKVRDVAAELIATTRRRRQP